MLVGISIRNHTNWLFSYHCLQQSKLLKISILILQHLGSQHCWSVALKVLETVGIDEDLNEKFLLWKIWKQTIYIWLKYERVTILFHFKINALSIKCPIWITKSSTWYYSVLSTCQHWNQSLIEKLYIYYQFIFTISKDSDLLLGFLLRIQNPHIYL